jgi:hypothetical protein
MAFSVQTSLRELSVAPSNFDTIWHRFTSMFASVCGGTSFLLPTSTAPRAIDLTATANTAVATLKIIVILKSHIKAIHRAAIDSENDDDLIHELDTVASALHLTSHQGA